MLLKYKVFLEDSCVEDGILGLIKLGRRVHGSYKDCGDAIFQPLLFMETKGKPKKEFVFWYNAALEDFYQGKRLKLNVVNKKWR